MPGVGGEQGVHHGPLVELEVVVQQALTPQPFIYRPLPVFLVPQAIGMVGEKIELLGPASSGRPGHGPFQGIGAAGVGPVLVDHAALFAQERTGLFRVVGHLQHDCRKEGIVTPDHQGVSFQKLTRRKAKPPLQPDNIGRIESQVLVPAALHIADHARVTGKAERRPAQRLHPGRKDLCFMYGFCCHRSSGCRGLGYRL